MGVSVGLGADSTATDSAGATVGSIGRLPVVSVPHATAMAARTPSATTDRFGDVDTFPCASFRRRRSARSSRSASPQMQSSLSVPRMQSCRRSMIGTSKLPAPSTSTMR